MSRALVPVIAAVAFGLAACGDEGSSGGRESAVASFYPLAFATAQIGGDIEVVDLTPAGTEPHDLELTPDQVDAILDAHLAVVMGDGFQPAVEDVAAEREGVTVTVLDTVPSDGTDPHVWLDPVRMQAVVAAIADGLVAADPDHAAAYQRRARALDRRLADLDTEFEAGLAGCARDTIVTAHDAFGYLTGRYGLEQLAIAGISPDEEPSPARLAELADLARDESVTTIFTETLVSADVADTLAREAGGLDTAVLNPLEGLSDDEVAAGDDYFSVMRANLAALRAALGCR
jgi:zinc transport system substrate-binding protein